MKMISSVFLVICVICAVIPMPIPGKEGTYNKISGLIWCENERACVHEIGHKLDDEAGWISHSKEFSLTVSAFVWLELSEKDTPHPYVYKIMIFPGVFRNTPSFFTDDNAELYASLFEWSRGVSENMPELLRPFYDWERAQELIEKLRGRYDK